MNRKPLSKIKFVISGALLLALCFLGFVMAARYTQFIVGNHATTTGVVTQESYHTPGTRNGNHIRYSYQVSGVMYQGYVDSLNDYKIGTQIPVTYKVTNPSASIIGTPWGADMILGTIVGIFGIGGFVWLAVRYGRQQT